VNVVDANVLLYAVNEQSVHHDEARTWLDTSLSGDALVGFTWVALLAFIRLATKANIFPHPLDIGGSFERVEHWLSSPAAILVEPTAGHASLMRSLLASAGTAGNLVNDAHLAAIALGHRGRVVTYDSDFARFAGVTWVSPATA